jgi:hypothetical protein
MSPSPAPPAPPTSHPLPLHAAPAAPKKPWPPSTPSMTSSPLMPASSSLSPAPAFTTYGGWGSKFRNKYFEPFYKSELKDAKAKGGDVGKFSTARTVWSAMSQLLFAARIRACSLMLLACAPLGAASRRRAARGRSFAPLARARRSEQALGYGHCYSYCSAPRPTQQPLLPFPICQYHFTKTNLE